MDDPDAAGASDDDSGENSAELNFLASASMATSSLRLRQVTSDQIKLSVHAPLALASAAGRRCPLCEHGALACRFVAVDGGAVFALEIKYVSARTAVCAAPEALTPSWSAALLEAAYYVEFSNDNTAFSRVPSGGDAASGDAASDGDAATPFVFTVSPPPSASSFSPEATALEGGATISVRGSDFAPGAALACSFSPEDAAADDGVSLARAVVAASFVSSFDVQAAAVPSLGLDQCRHWRSSNLW